MLISCCYLFTTVGSGVARGACLRKGYSSEEGKKKGQGDDDEKGPVVVGVRGAWTWKEQKRHVVVQKEEERRILEKVGEQDVTRRERRDCLLAAE